MDSTVDLLGGRDTHRQGLAVTRKQGSFVTVVGPEQHVGQRRLSAFQLMGMLGRISWSMLGSRFSGPRYVFAAPLAPDWGAIHQSLVKPNIRPAIDRIVEFGEESVRDAIGYVETVQSERISEGSHVVRPVRQCAAGLRIRLTKPRSVRRDEAHVPGDRLPWIEPRGQPAAWAPVKHEDRQPVRVTEVLKRQAATIRQLMEPGAARLGERS